MTSKDECARYLRKEYLLFKARKNKGHEYLERELASALGPDEFCFIEEQTLQALRVKSIESGVAGRAHYNFDKLAEFVLTVDLTNGLDLSLSLGRGRCDDWVFVLPSEWAVLGGFSVKLGALLEKFINVSVLVDNDFYMFDYGLGNCASFAGDDVGNKCMEYQVVCRGAYFNFFSDLGKKP